MKSPAFYIGALGSRTTHARRLERLKSQGFTDAGAHVVLIYPGPPQDLGARANEFLADKKLPNNFDLLVDPGYTFTNLYGLRWNATQETAYPSTFLVDQQGVV